jgi:peptide/nickel transport system permease protein
MLHYLYQRLFYSIFVIWGVVTMVFVIMRLVPGDPASLLLGSVATQEDVAALRAQMGLDQAIGVQYLLFLRSAATGDLGTSLYVKRPAMDLVVERLPATVELTGFSLLLSLVVAFPLGILSALRANGVLDRLAGLFTLAAESLPNYWIGLMLILIFARNLQWLPTFGRGGLDHLILPGVTLSLALIAAVVRLVRAGMLEEMGKEYVRTARAKGLRERVVIRRHALKNLLIPVVTVVGLQFGALLGGAVIVETVFAWPGVGSAVVEAIQNRDYSVIQAVVLVIASVFVVVNLAVDLLYAYLDPRIRYG